MSKFYLCDTSLESGTGDDGFKPVMNTSGYETEADAYLAAFHYVGMLPPDSNPRLQIRSESTRSELFLARNFRWVSV